MKSKCRPTIQVLIIVNYNSFVHVKHGLRTHIQLMVLFSKKFLKKEFLITLLGIVRNFKKITNNIHTISLKFKGSYT